ncbi:MAG: DUF2975 domain-containing protein [Bacilli bacterium]|jgi:hypothetical protein
MKHETLFLRVVVCFIGIFIFSICVFGLPWGVREAVKYYPTFVLYPILIVMYVSAIPFFFALYEGFKLLTYIDQNKAFSELSVVVLKNIKYCAIIISILYTIVLPFFYYIAKLDNAPGILLIGLIISFASIVVMVLAAILQKLLKNAVDIKTENDLTV